MHRTQARRLLHKNCLKTNDKSVDLRKELDIIKVAEFYITFNDAEYVVVFNDGEGPRHFITSERGILCQIFFKETD